MSDYTEEDVQELVGHTTYSFEMPMSFRMSGGTREETEAKLREALSQWDNCLPPSVNGSGYNINDLVLTSEHAVTEEEAREFLSWFGRTEEQE